MHIVITFASTHQALTVEKAIGNKNIHYEIIPTPRSLSASCGLSVKVSAADFSCVQAIIKDLKLKVNAYRAQGGSYESINLLEG